MGGRVGRLVRGLDTRYIKRVPRFFYEGLYSIRSEPNPQTQQTRLYTNFTFKKQNRKDILTEFGQRGTSFMNKTTPKKCCLQCSTLHRIHKNINHVARRKRVEIGWLEWVTRGGNEHLTRGGFEEDLHLFCAGVQT